MASDSAAQAKCWTFNNSGYPSALHTATLPVATTPPTPSHIIIRVHAVALNPVDIQIMNMSIWGLPLPFAPFNDANKRMCEDYAGEVLAVGADVKHKFKVGDRVMGFAMSLGGSDGTLGEIASINTKSGAAVKLPSDKNWTWEQMAALPLVWLTARTTIASVEGAMKSASSTGRRPKLVVLGGSSATGMYAVRMARQRNWEVLSTCSGRNVDFVSSMGASSAVDYTQQSVPEEVKTFKPDAIIDSVGGTETIGLSKRYVTIVGDKTSRTSMGGFLTYFWNPQMVLRKLLGGVTLGVDYDCVNIDPRNEYLEEAFGLRSDEIIIDSTFSFDQVKQAFERLNTGRCRGKVIIKFGDP